MPSFTRLSYFFAAEAAGLAADALEAGAAAAGGIANLNLQRRSEMALQRHTDFMRKKLEQQQEQQQQPKESLVK